MLRHLRLAWVVAGIGTGAAPQPRSSVRSERVGCGPRLGGRRAVRPGACGRRAWLLAKRQTESSRRIGRSPKDGPGPALLFVAAGFPEFPALHVRPLPSRTLPRSLATADARISCGNLLMLLISWAVVSKTYRARMPERRGARRTGSAFSARGGSRRDLSLTLIVIASVVLLAHVAGVDARLVARTADRAANVLHRPADREVARANTWCSGRATCASVDDGARCSQPRSAMATGARGRLTQAELARLCGVTRQTIIALEAGKYSPSLELAFQLARALGRRSRRSFSLRRKKFSGAQPIRSDWLEFCVLNDRVGPLYSDSMFTDTSSIVSWRSRPRSFVALMSLYESNYLRLAHLAGDLQGARRRAHLARGGRL